jgi:hypothetical protein
LTPRKRADTLFLGENVKNTFGKFVATPIGNPFAAKAVSSSDLIARLPKVWIGYLLALATLIGEMIAVAEHPELAKNTEFVIPPLTIFLPAFIALVYWFTCVYRYHVVLANVPGWNHPVTPARAVWFHLIPIFNLYWLFRWPYAIAVFVNQRMNAAVMSLWAAGASFLIALLCRVFEPALGTTMLFFTCGYISRQLKRALEAQVSTAE